jgi:hypothetical protein
MQQSDDSAPGPDSGSNTGGVTLVLQDEVLRDLKNRQVRVAAEPSHDGLPFFGTLGATHGPQQGGKAAPECLAKVEGGGENRYAVGVGLEVAKTAVLALHRLDNVLRQIVRRGDLHETDSGDELREVRLYGGDAISREPVPPFRGDPLPFRFQERGEVCPRLVLGELLEEPVVHALNARTALPLSPGRSALGEACALLLAPGRSAPGEACALLLAPRCDTSSPFAVVPLLIARVELIAVCVLYAGGESLSDCQS